jgi:HAE1 family hydrophobic/amphiphilic exporter-1
VSLPGFAVKRPVTVIMIVLFSVVLGIISLTRLPIDLFPDMNVPMAVVMTTYEGAGPKEVETLVTIPLEEIIVTVDKVKGVNSSSTQGQSLIIVEFDWGTDMDIAMLEMRERIDRIKSYLPDGVDSPLVLKVDLTEMPIQEYAITGNMGLDKLRTFVDETMKPRLERVDGVASVEVSGGLERQIQILLDPGKMKMFGISLDQVVQCITLSNLNLPAGSITHESDRLTVRTVGEFESLDDLENVAVFGEKGIYYLKDIAEIHDTFKDVTQYARVNGQDSIGISIQKASQANAVEVAEKVREVFIDIEREFGKSIQISTISDRSVFIRLAMDTVTSSAVYGGLLAILILFVFLRSVKPTLIISFAIPISIITTFIFMYLSKMTLNLLSMGGLALGIGMLVDNAIVVLENIYRLRAEGVDSFEAAVNGTDQVGMAITASTITNIVVFLPIMFIQGITAEIFRTLSIMVSFSLMVSLIVAMTFIPMMASRLLTSAGKHYAFTEGEAGSGIQARMLAWYGLFLKKVMPWRWLMVIVSMTLTVVSFFMIPNIGQEFLPNMDEGYISIEVSIVKGSPLERTNNVVRYIEEQLERIPEIETVMSVIGEGESTDSAKLSVKLVSVTDRKRTTTMVVEDIRSRLENILVADISVMAVSNLAGGGYLTGSEIQLAFTGDSMELLEQVLREMTEVIRGIPGVRKVISTIEEQRPELQISIHRNKAASYGLTPVQIAAAVRAAIEGQVATKYKVDGGEIDVLVRLTDSARNDLSALQKVPLPTPLGIMVPLEEVAEVSRGYSPVIITRLQQSRGASLYVQFFGVDAGTVKKEINARLKNVELPSSIEYSYEGESKWMEEAFTSLTEALILSVFLVYMILASQFESLWQPFAILFSVPFAFVGVVLSLVITGKTLNVVSYIGVIMLVGVVVNNGIVLIDFINQLRAKGVSREEAISIAGKTRLRPILMTTLTTFLGLIPMALGTGEGGELVAPLGIVVIGGMTVSTILTLVIVPVTYSIIEDIINFFRRIMGRGMLTGQSVETGRADKADFLP